MGSTGRDGPAPATVTQRVLGLLAAFDADHPRLALTELARRAGLPLSTAHRLVGELTGWGALERGDDGRYRIGLRLWEIGALAPRSVGLREAALPFLTDLQEVTGENVQLAVLDGTEVVYVERLSGRRAVNVITRVGGRLPLHATGVGLVLLAHAPPELQERVLAAPLRRYTEHTITTPAQLRRVLADVRRSGVAVSDRQIELVALSVAAPVRAPGGEVVAALSVVVPAAGSDPRAYVPVVRAAARGVSRVLGPPRGVAVGA
ncbi:IclR family transcriptional regulator [Pseudonocardia hydrocarbonoxydans]|uniref:Glycerol operon regulatory protein n=1 Tax=Pseudonocardia hydrocarbonoxydans TaxID=76726 RepID=A0A4Y3WIN0_9PSEU|nr:IclR family transcriptional regulator [Pseudonocardia hydrocarbonoxydans]GEC18802.1 IclR family transcriptional regulator [Pseudonocardia hydrocarbonoxydans]